ncbi:hypothetical protein LEP1GSC125_0802 [Leptospira mayottensis 200901122]|uniref:Uncharacterized protein n=1 Tax=Leptospira mayottensis 200901122 TaxID=1193010 RepID=A0AA87MTJ2_9LEPT|nr:hypothetical protein LEP1GSC125_0802 [Leptospira mayottensis 200901122]
MKFKTLSIFVLLNLIHCVSNSKYESLLKSYEESKLENQRILGEKANLSRSLNELKRIQEESELRIQEYRGLIATFRSLIDAGKLKIKIIDENGCGSFLRYSLFGGFCISIVRRNRIDSGSDHLACLFGRKTFSN